MANPPMADQLIPFNRELLAAAEEARRNSQELVLRSTMDRVQRCLSDVYREPAWALEMAEWVAGIRPWLPPRGKGRASG